MESREKARGDDKPYDRCSICERRKKIKSNLQVVNEERQIVANMIKKKLRGGKSILAGNERRAVVRGDCKG